MPIDAKFLSDVLATDGDVESKKAKILAEYEADVNGLKVNRDNILQEKGALEDKVKGFAAQETDFKKQIADLSEKIKKSGSEDLKKFYEAEQNRLTEEHQKKFAALETERNQFRDEAMKFYKNDEFEKAVKELKVQIRPEVSTDLRDLFYSRNAFERKLIDGAPKFLNDGSRSVQDILGAYLQTDTGKFYLVNGNSGGGGSGSKNPGAASKPEPKTSKEALAAALGETQQ